MYHCPNCNQPILEDDTHCPGCGSALDQTRIHNMAQQHRHTRRLRLIARSVFSVAVLLLTGVAIYYMVSSYNTIRTTATRPTPENPYKPTTLTPHQQDGQAGQLLSVFGRTGDRVVVKALGRTLTLQEGTAQLFIPDDPFIPEQPQSGQQTVSVDLGLMLYPISGEKETPMELGTYQIAIPSTPLQVLLPELEDNAQLSTSQSELEVVFKATADSAVYLNGEIQNIRPADAEAGIYRITVPLGKEGPQQLRIGAQRPGHTLAEAAISVNRLGMPVKLEVSAEIAKQVTGLEFEITGTTDPDAVMTANLPLSAATIDGRTGAFRLVVKLPRYGRTPIELKAEKGGKTSQWTYEVYAAPDKETYTTTAWKLEYDELVQSPNQYKGKPFAFAGIVRSVNGIKTQTIDFWIDGDSTKAVTLVYEGLAVIKENVEYRVFADAAGGSQQPPRLDVRFIYER